VWREVSAVELDVLGRVAAVRGHPQVCREAVSPSRPFVFDAGVTGSGMDRSYAA